VAAITEPPNDRPTLPYGGETYQDVLDFLYREADALDDRRHHEWLAMLADDIRYHMPIRVTSAHSLTDSVLPAMAHFDEDMFSLRKRVERFDTEHAWAEDPPSRTRRFVTNVRCWPGEADDEVIAVSNVLLFRSRGDVRDSDLVSARRVDVLRREDGTLRLARREVLVDESVLRTQNLAVFL
jgi:3-phenylpropionate/cinnamic acid dioxygenase small subunit